MSAEANMAADTRPSELFPATAWTLVCHARENGEGREAALEVLCASYWQPVRRYLMALGCLEHEAADVTQEFFASFLRGGGFSTAARGQGRLRSLLKQSAKHHLFSHWRRSMAEKRGGGESALPLDEEVSEAAGTTTDETGYDLDWALTVMDAALRRLQESYANRGRGAVFEVIKTGLLRPGGMPDDRATAAALEISESQVRLAVHRARQRLHTMLREEVAQTVAPAEVDDELRYILAVLLQGGET